MILSSDYSLILSFNAFVLKPKIKAINPVTEDERAQYVLAIERKKMRYIVYRFTYP